MTTPPNFKQGTGQKITLRDDVCRNCQYWKPRERPTALMSMSGWSDPDSGERCWRYTPWGLNQKPDDLKIHEGDYCSDFERRKFRLMERIREGLCGS